VSSTADRIYYQLIASLASILGEERCIKQCLPIVEEMAKDNVFYVRKEAASAIGSLAAVVNRNVVVDKLVSNWFSVSLHILVIISNLYIHFFDVI
jgi:H2-forming N5,N10-methylenetetrahydromethanopterin dehydrogenase-like enzyme